jgi:hypothetical protein
MTSTSSRGSVRAHGAEVSTDQDALRGYAEPIALLVAIFAIVAAAWAVMTPSSDADLTQVTPAAPAEATFVRAPLDTSDVVQPDTSRSASTAVLAPTVFELMGVRG